ncbi:MAG: aminoglycoside phosphotransferase family protein [Rhabdochlamydiaceae bacterium]|nr:aminoglycoside phosphotransferase family protein [Candidatus Amphrikana amoebophyrae]
MHLKFHVLMIINELFVKNLISTQFPQWKYLPINSVKSSGWDNKTFHLGDQMIVRLPSALEYAPQIKKEYYWLPKLDSNLPLLIPTPVALGQPDDTYPWHWAIYQWIEGEQAHYDNIDNLSDFAGQLANFLRHLQSIESIDGPKAGADNFYRGGDIAIYSEQVINALDILNDKVDRNTIIKLWELAIKTAWTGKRVWVHGDISCGNLLVHNGKLHAVIDFGLLSVGDPACDLTIAWTFFDEKSRRDFFNELALGSDTQLRSAAWALWKALIVAADISQSNNFEAKRCLHVIAEVVCFIKSYLKNNQ